MYTISNRFLNLYLAVSCFCMIANSFIDIRYNIYQADYSYSFIIPFLWIILSVIIFSYILLLFSKEYKNHKLYIKNNYPELYQILWRQGGSGLIFGKNINFIKLKYDNGNDPIVNSVRNEWAFQISFIKKLLLCYFIVMSITIIFILTLR